MYAGKKHKLVDAESFNIGRGDVAA